jgi:peptidoglycan lytic transglycosylase G
MSKRSFRIALIVVLSSVVLLAAAGAWVVNAALSYPEHRHAGKGTEVQVTVASGMSFPQIASLLHDKGIIDRPRWFRLYAMHRGVTTKVRTGDYALRDDMTPHEVLDKLLAGVKDLTVSVTVPEGINMLEVFAIMEQAGVAKAAELELLARDPAFLEKHAIEGESVEGYLFPETYSFRVPTAPKVVLETLINQFRTVWERVAKDKAKSMAKLKKELSWTDRDVLILASIVEKEAVASTEQPRIAQVFINRLTDASFVPHRLDTDPTIRYGCLVPVKKSPPCQQWDKTDRLHRIQLDDKDNPYNTYQHDGLPPGPISNPGEKALAGTMDPDGSRFFYFVSRNDGTHVFARTRQEHERNVDSFQR